MKKTRKNESKMQTYENKMIDTAQMNKAQQEADETRAAIKAFAIEALGKDKKRKPGMGGYGRKV